MRGEKKSSPLCAHLPQGSPPHARGKVFSVSFHIKPPGITPACAGKSPGTHTPRHSTRDHPRMLGEKFRAACTAPQFAGSPPHARGKVMNDAISRSELRITPACAGKRLRKPRKINACRNAVQRFSFSFSKTAWVMRQSSRARCVRVASMPRCAASVASL